MAEDLENLPDDIAELKRIIGEQILRNHNNEIKVKLLEERISLLQSRLFSKRSEKLSAFDEKQSLLFNEIEAIHDGEPELPLDEIHITVSSHKRAKKISRSLPDDLERRIEILDIPATEKICGCGCVKSKIGEEISEKLDYIPAKAFVRRIIRPKYACRKCFGGDDEGQAVTIAPVKPTLLGKSILSEGVFGHIITSKFCDALPFYRQESIFRRAGVEVSRKTMASCTMRAAEGLQPLYRLLLEQLVEADCIGIDETRFQVLKEPGKRPEQLSFLWHILAHTREGPIPVFIYRPDRSANFLKEILKYYSGPVITDAYKSYNILEENLKIPHALCNAHARRKFIDADKVSPGNKEIRQILEIYKKLYRVESDWKKSGSDSSSLLSSRMSISQPLFDELKQILDRLALQTNPSGALGKAIAYTINEWDRLTLYVNHPQIPIDNNAVENGIRPFVIGRKNWLFSDTQSGAYASALFYTLIEGAKSAGLDPYLYMSYLLTHAPFAVSDSQWRALLPIHLKGKDLSI